MLPALSLAVVPEPSFNLYHCCKPLIPKVSASQFILEANLDMSGPDAPTAVPESNSTLKIFTSAIYPVNPAAFDAFAPILKSPALALKVIPDAVA